VRPAAFVACVGWVNSRLRAAGYFAFGALPVPVSETICGASAPLSLMISSPFCGVVSIGAVKVTLTSQSFFGAKVLSQAVLTVKGEAVVSPVTITSIFELFELSLVIFTDLDLLVLPSSVLSPKFSAVGEIFSIPTPGVGVEVGVGVAVLLAVGDGDGDGVIVVVAVAVAVFVGVGVAVGV